MVMTSDREGSRVPTRARRKDPKQRDGMEPEGGITVGRIFRERMLYWAVHPAERLHLGGWSANDWLFADGVRPEPPTLAKIDGREAVRVEWSMDSMNPPGSAVAGVLWFGRDLGYAVIHSENSRRPTPDSPWKKIAESKCYDFALVGGVWLPCRITLVEHTYWDDGFYEL